MTETKHDIFLSYSRKDKERVKPIVQLLEAQGWSVWWDPKIPHGVNFADYIEEQLDNAKIVIVVWSSHSVKSKWVKAEANEGREKGILFPIKVENIKPPLIFRPIQTANFTSWQGNLNTSEAIFFINSINKRLNGTSIQLPSIVNDFQDLDSKNGLLIDIRDGQNYKTIKIGQQIWMAENLNFKVKNSWWYKNKKKNGKKFGRLYTWESAKKACPEGWHLPTDKEWKILLKNYGGKGKKAYKVLTFGGKENFAALHGGSRSTDGYFSGYCRRGEYWSSTKYNSANARSYLFLINDKKLYRHYDKKTCAFSCRCIKD